MPPVSISHDGFLRIVLSLPRPVSLLRCMVGYRQPPASTAPKVNRNCTARWLPQSPAVTAPSRRELWGAYFSTLDLWELEVPAVNPSVTPPACQLPLAREPCGQCPLTISHGNLLRFVTSLTRPVSAACPPNFFTIHSSLFPKKAWSCYCGGNRGIDQSPPC